MPDPGLPPLSAVVVGASRGIGLALCQELLSRSDQSQVLAISRQANLSEALEALSARYAGRVRALDIDITVDQDIRTLAAAIREDKRSPDLLMMASGVLHEGKCQPEKALSQANRDWLDRQFQVNAISPLLLARAVLPLMSKDRPIHLAALSAMVGSITDNRLGGWYGYRASKAALNQFLKTLAIEAHRTNPNLCVTSIHPGTTDTDLSRPFQGNVPDGKLYTPSTSAQRILDVVLSGTPEDSGRFMNWDGEPIAW